MTAANPFPRMARVQQLFPWRAPLEVAKAVDQEMEKLTTKLPPRSSKKCQKKKKEKEKVSPIEALMLFSLILCAREHFLGVSVLWKEQAQHDKERDRNLQSLGYPVFR